MVALEPDVVAASVATMAAAFSAALELSLRFDSKPVHAWILADDGCIMLLDDVDDSAVNCK